MVDVLSQDLENFHEDYILRDSNMRGDQRAENMLKIVLSQLMWMIVLFYLNVIDQKFRFFTIM